MAEQPSLFGLDPKGNAGLIHLRRSCETCTKCVLAKTRTQVVFGEGNAEAPSVCFIGEGPGETEDETGRPFVGRAGHVLNNMIKLMGLNREDVFITNVVKCRPPFNRPPTKGEVDACRDYLIAQIRAIQPRVLVCLGASAVNALLGGKKKIGEVRGKWFEYLNIPLIATYHPSAIARAEREPNYNDMKKVVWGDLQLVLNKLGLPIPEIKKKT